MQSYKQNAIPTTQHSPVIWEWFVDDIYSALKRMHLEKFFNFSVTSTSFTIFIMEEESNGEIAFFDNLLIKI